MAITLAVKCPPNAADPYRVARWFPSTDHADWNGSQWVLREPPVSIRKHLGYIHVVDPPPSARVREFFEQSSAGVYIAKPPSWVRDSVARDGQVTVAWGDLQLLTTE